MLYSPTGSVIARPSGRATRAERQPEREQEVREKLQAIDSLLDIQYVEWAGRYALMVKWPESDPRWEMYRNGEIGSPFDNLGWFCEDMQNPDSMPTTVDGIENKVLALLASCDNTKQSWKARLAQTVEHNAKVKKQRQQIALEQVEDVAKTLWQAAGKHDAHKMEKILEEVARGAT